MTGGEGRGRPTIAVRYDLRHWHVELVAEGLQPSVEKVLPALPHPCRLGRGPMSTADLAGIVTLDDIEARASPPAVSRVPRWCSSNSGRNS